MIQYNVLGTSMHVKINQDVHFENARELELYLQTFAVEKEIEKLDIDLSNVQFIDSTGIGMLITWLYPLSEKHSIEIKGASVHVKRILSICRMHEFTTIA